ncbi:hypothetical protein D3C74_459910 [compost metagenome]
MFTYVVGVIISIITKVNREDERIANEQEGTNYFRLNDVYRNGPGDDDFQFVAHWDTWQVVPA